MREGWKEVKFGEVVEFPPKIKMLKGSKYPFIPMELIDGGYKYVKPIEEKELTGGGAKFEEGDTLFARITPCLQNGKIAQAKKLNNKPGFGSTEYFIFRGIPNVTDNDYVYYLSQMQEFRDNAINSMVGASGRQRADAGHVKSFVFNLPPLETQKKIAAILSRYDDLIENNLKRIKILEEMAQQTYEEWFVRMRFPGYEDAIINEETGLSEGWERVKIEDLCTVSGGGTPSKSNEEYWVEGDINWFTPTDLTKNKSLVITESELKTNTLGIAKSSARILQSNSFIMTSRATIGVFAILDKPFSTNQGFINITPNNDNLKGYLLHSFIFRMDQLKGLATGTTFPELSKSKFKVLDIVNPTDDILNQFSNQFSIFQKQLFNLTYQNQRLREARDILLPRLMMGMIEV